MAYVNLGQVVYPVGSVYVSYTSTSPASLFGGNWTAITGRFPYFNNGTGTGGANSVSHSHDSGNIVANIGACNSNTSMIAYAAVDPKLKIYNMRIGGGNGSGPGSFPTNHSTSTIGNTGSTSISTMPAYQTFYAWRRTS